MVIKVNMDLYACPRIIFVENMSRGEQDSGFYSLLQDWDKKGGSTMRPSTALINNNNNYYYSFI